MEELELIRIKVKDKYNVDKLFNLKLNKLKILYITRCTDIDLEYCCSNLIKLTTIIQTIKTKWKPALKMPNLEYLEIHNLDYESCFDYKSFKKLKTFIDDLQYFKYLDSPLLENVHLDFKSFGKAEKTEVLRKLINTKTLKKLEFERFDLTDTEISKIERINTSLMELKLEFISKTLKFDLSYLKEKFPNLCRISIICYIQNKDKNNSIELK